MTVNNLTYTFIMYWYISILRNFKNCLELNLVGYYLKTIVL